MLEKLKQLDNRYAELGQRMENGMKEAEFCRGILDKAQQTITVYTEENADA